MPPAKLSAGQINVILNRWPLSTFGSRQQEKAVSLKFQLVQDDLTAIIDLQKLDFYEVIPIFGVIRSR